MRSSRFMILLLLSMLSVLGCTPTTNTTLQGVGMTGGETDTVPNSSTLEMGYTSVQTWVLEGDPVWIPINARNISFTDMESVTTTIESDLPGFSTTDAEFALPAGSNHMVVIEFDAGNIEVEIGQPLFRNAVVVVQTDAGEVHQVFIDIVIFDEMDYTENQLSVWTTQMYMSATAGDSAVTESFTLRSNWNEPVSYTAIADGAGFQVSYNGTGTMTAGSTDQVWVQYTPPIAMANSEHETEEYLGLLTIETSAGSTHEVTIYATVHNPDSGETEEIPEPPL